MSNDSPENNPKIEQAAASDEHIQHVHSVLLREKKEPTEGYTPMPLFLLGFVSSMIFVVSIYFIHTRGGLTEGLATASMIYDERYDPASAGSGPRVVEIDPHVAGQRLFMQVCATCHQATGTGLTGVYPPLAGSEWVTGSEERLIRILLHGLSGQIEVAGQNYAGITPMPAFGAGSTYNWRDDQISYVLTFIRSEWGNEAEPITAEAVTAIRETVGARSESWTADQLLALP